ncbi:response regulator transcription factor, partial [Streptomyces sp. NPDC056049]
PREGPARPSGVPFVPSRARELFISPATAKAHVARLFTRLDARDRIHLVILAYEFGLVSPYA